MRRPYVMRAVVRAYRRRPPWAEREAARLASRGAPVPSYVADARETALDLACGHTTRDPWETYGNETAVAVRAVTHALLTPDAPRRVRCYDCARTREEP